MRRMTVMVAALAAVVMAGVAAVPATVAGAATPTKLWVSNSTPVAPGAGAGKSCSNPGYSTVQSAVNNAGNFGASIEICAGTYTEQVTITNSVKLVSSGGAVTLKMPTTPVNNPTTCDATLGDINSGHYGQPGQDEVSICGAGNVSISNITLSAYAPAGYCYDSFYGVFAGQGSNLTTNGLTVTGAGVPLGDSAVGCQGGVGIEVGSARDTGQAASATLKNTTVSGYQKNGITVAGTGSSMTVKNATVTGRGPVGTAENGIQVSYGALGTITGAQVSNNNCVLLGVCGSDAMQYSQSTGILFYGAGAGSSVKNSTFTGNDIGIAYYATGASVPASPEVTISKNTVTSSVDEGIQLDVGKAALSHDTINGTGPIGIQVLQYNGQAYAPASSASHESISGQGIGVQVYSDLAGPGDLAGTFTIAHSQFLHTNTTALTNNSPNYTTAGAGNS